MSESSFNSKTYLKILENESQRKEREKIAKKRHDNAKYLSVQAHLDKELVIKFREILKTLGLNQSDVVKYFVEDFIINGDKYVSKIDDINSLIDNGFISPKFDYKVIRLDKLLSEISDKYKLYEYLHSGIYTYIKLSEIKGLCLYLNIEHDKSCKSRSELVYKVYMHYLNVIENKGDEHNA